MKREEEIKKVADNYATRLREPFENPPSNYHIGIYDGFIKGAEWVDSNPKNPWISVKDRLPDEKVNVITISKLGVINRCYLKKGIWKMVDYILYMDGDEIVYWMPILELPNNN